MLPESVAGELPWLQKAWQIKGLYLSCTCLAMHLKQLEHTLHHATLAVCIASPLCPPSRSAAIAASRHIAASSAPARNSSVEGYQVFKDGQCCK